MSSFFIVGCVRSGTTMLRDVLRRHPDLACPEETQYYRWGHPFGTPGFAQCVLKPPVLVRHRSLDGLDEEAFRGEFDTARSRADLTRRHMTRFLEATGQSGRCWFDKSPQNVYGLPLLLHDFPDAKFIHIVRNPVDVVASLLRGAVIAAPSVLAAANYWFEAVAIVNTLKPVFGPRLLEVVYEDFTRQPLPQARSVLDFLGLDRADLSAATRHIHETRHDNRELLTAADYAVIAEICGAWATSYGYSLGPEPA